MREIKITHDWAKEVSISTAVGIACDDSFIKIINMLGNVVEMLHENGHLKDSQIKKLLGYKFQIEI